MLWATLLAAWKWETGHGAGHGQLLWLLVNQVKDFSPLCGQEYRVGELLTAHA